MNKRQRKKQRTVLEKKKSLLLVIADEFNLMTMTDEEYKKAMRDYEKFKENYVRNKSFKQIKEIGMIRYYYPQGKKQFDLIKKIGEIGRSKNTKSIVSNQKLSNFEN